MKFNLTLMLVNEFMGKDWVGNKEIKSAIYKLTGRVIKLSEAADVKRRIHRSGAYDTLQKQAGKESVIKVVGLKDRKRVEVKPSAFEPLWSPTGAFKIMNQVWRYHD